MPVYGKGRTKRNVHTRIGKRLRQFVIDRDMPDYERKYAVRKKYYSDTGHWFRYLTSPLSLVQRGLNFNIRAWVEDRFSATERPVRVVDLGCGPGKAITTLSRKLGPKVDAIGFDHKLYHTWIKEKRTRFVHEQIESFHRFFPKDSLDMIYSHHGAYHILETKNGAERLEQLGKIIQSLRKGGIFVSNIDRFSPKQLGEMLAYLQTTFPDCHSYFRTVRQYGRGDLPVLLVQREPVQKRRPRERQLDLFPLSKSVHIRLR